jgi:hypothetical protein
MLLEPIPPFKSFKKYIKFLEGVGEKDIAVELIK